MPEVFKSRFKESLRIKFLIGFLTVVLIVLMFPRGESLEYEVPEGSVWINDDLIAPFSFPILKSPDVYRQEIQNAKKRVYPVYLKYEDKTTAALDSFKVYIEYLKNIFDKTLAEPNTLLVNTTFLSDNSFDFFFKLYKQKKKDSNEYGIGFSRLFEKAQDGLIKVYKKGIIDLSSEGAFRDSVALRTGNIDVIEPVNKFLTVEQANSEIGSFLKGQNYSSEIENAIIEFTQHFIVPNIYYNADFTNAEILQAESEISKYSGIVNENERIIAKHERVTKEAKLKIDSFKAAKGEKYQEKGSFFQQIGKFLHIASLVSLLSIYFFNFRKRIFYDNLKLLVFALIFVFISFVTFLVNQITVAAPLQFLIFVPAASMILTIIFDSRVGFYSTVIISLITAALRGNDYSFAVMNLFAGALGVYTVRDIKNRSQIFRSFFFILIGYLVAVVAFGLEKFSSFSNIMIELAFASANAIISPVLTYGLLIFFEKLFNLTTDLTLLELSNFDHPLLRELARKAPGTFNHSMTMGTIAETAAEKIGANPLLARVGAYYHDIGKMIAPKNFVENQISEENIHEDVMPEESVDIIRQHVEEGIKLAKQHNLPEEVVDFIPMHHGTMVIKYFYERAKEKYGEDNVDVDEFRYSGPIPNSKETAVVMLADGCESAVRSIEDPDQEKIENVINNIINDRLESGQLDNSPLTLKDIDKIRESFKSILIGQHHKRIRYPDQDEIERGDSNEIEQ